MHIKKAFFRFLPVFLCLTVFISCFSSCHRGTSSKNVNWLLSSSPKNLDPQTATLDSELLIIKNCFSPLFEKDEKGEMFSSFVESYGSSKDGKRYVFNLYNDKKWTIYQKGNAEVYSSVTAHDFKFAIQRVFTDSPNSDVMKVLKNIKNADKVLSGEDAEKLGVYCPNDYTLEIILSKATPTLIEAFANHKLFPCNEDFFNSTSGRYGLSENLIISNGSFCVSFFGESSVRLVRNPYAATKTIASSVTLYLPKESRDAVSLLKEGDIDAAVLSSDKMDTLDNKSSFSIKEKTAVVWTMIFNKNNELWKNENLRKAVMLCTDKAVLNSGNSSHLHPANRIISNTAVLSSHNYHSLTPNISTEKLNLQKAKTLYQSALVELGQTKIYNTPILIADSTLHKDSFSALNQVYQRELSLYFSPEYASLQEITQRVKNGDFSAAVVPLYVSSDTPQTILEYFSEHSPLCILPITSDEFTQSFSAVQSLSISKESAELYGKAEKAIYDSKLVIPLYYQSSYFVSASSVSGFREDGQGIVIFKDVIK